MDPRLRGDDNAHIVHFFLTAIPAGVYPALDAGRE
jgi:hypothetical protein